MKAYIEISSLVSMKNYIVIDVRSPCEFKQGHIPGAHNIPLFSDEERAVVGTIYKQIGKSQAIKKGLEIVGPKLLFFVEAVEKINLENSELIIQCFRGGMRSQSFSWLLTTAGIKNKILKGGYKAFRAFARNQFAIHYQLNVLGGLTGSGKTEILHELKLLGEQVIDLEGLAHHKGSAFGHLGNIEQFSNEQFENNLFFSLLNIDPAKQLWVEDEAQRIGQNIIPDAFFTQMRNSKMIQIEIPIEQRVARLMKDYGQFSQEDLIKALNRIQKKLGGDRLKRVTNWITNNEIDCAIRDILNYYDQTYNFGMSKRERSGVIIRKLHGANSQEHARELLNG